MPIPLIDYSTDAKIAKRQEELWNTLKWTGSPATFGTLAMAQQRAVNPNFDAKEFLRIAAEITAGKAASSQGPTE